MRDPYKILGLRSSATADDIKQAYRRLVKEVHPDLHPDDAGMEQRFKDVAAAYALLGDPAKRSRFDRGLIDADERPVNRWRAWRSQASTARPARSGAGDHADAQGRTGTDRTREAPKKDGGAGGFFRDIFRNGPKVSGADVRYELTVPFVDAAVGGRQPLTLSDDRTITVSIPPGAETDQVLRLKGQGLKGMGGGSPGDALVHLTVTPHSHFRRDGLNIHLTLPISLKEAILGATVDTPTVHGRVSLKIPPGSTSGRVLRLRGKGIRESSVNGEDQESRGDQLVTLELVMPSPPDPALKALVEGWNPPASYNPRRDAGF